MSEEPLPPELARHLGLACFAVINKLGVDAWLASEDGRVTKGKLARVGENLVIVERPGDRARSRPHHFVGYRVDETEPDLSGELNQAHALFVLQERHFDSPPEWHPLRCVQDPRIWCESVVVEIHLALEPFATLLN